jgi:hypothetical protein
VNELLSMLVPLETLSGWPQVENPTVLQSLTLFVGIPLLIAVIVIAIIEIGARARAGREDPILTSDPLWVGAQESAQIEPVSDSQEALTPAEAVAEVAGGQHSGEGDDTGEHVGGAGARW